MNRSADHVAERLARGPLVLDGAVGTELERLGVAMPAPLWSAASLLDAPQAVLSIHESYVRAGADILVANTFRTNPRALQRAGRYADGPAIAARAVELARKAARGSDTLVAASVGPAEDCYSPERVPPERELSAEHQVNAAWLSRAAPDLLWIETIGSAREARAAAAAAHGVGLPFVVSFILREDGKLLGGDSSAEAVAAVTEFEPLALGVNCVPPRGLAAGMAALRVATRLPLVAYGHVGNVRPLPGWSYFDSPTPEQYAALAVGWIEAGARVVGGCCGTGPAYIAALRIAVDRWRAERPASPGALV